MTDSTMLLLVCVTAVVAIGLVTHLMLHRRLHRAAREVVHQASELRAAINDLLQRLQSPLPPRYYFMRPGGVPQGPAELTTVRAMVADGRLGGDALVSIAGTDLWLPMAQLLAEARWPGSWPDG